MQIDIRVMELLASKLCHDLVSPVSAINNGVELIEDIGGSVVEEAMKLIGDSGLTASRRLRLFRMAYGRAGSEESLGAKDARQVAEQYLSGTKISLVWPEHLPAENVAIQRGFLKTLINVLILAEEALAYGGVVTLRESLNACCVDVVGRSAQLSQPLQDALSGTMPIEELSPRTIHAYVTGRFAAHFNLNLTFDQTASDRLEMTLAPPAAVARLVNVS